MPALLLAVSIAACDAQVAAPPATDAWVGRWNGPEGTYLEIAGKNGAYDVTVKDLDVARTFDGVGAGDRIEFRRDDTDESLRSTDGDATGMKWLAGNTNWVTITAGEGYCRD